MKILYVDFFTDTNGNQDTFNAFQRLTPTVPLDCNRGGIGALESTIKEHNVRHIHFGGSFKQHVAQCESVMKRCLKRGVTISRYYGDAHENIFVQSVFQYADSVTCLFVCAKQFTVGLCNAEFCLAPAWDMPTQTKFDTGSYDFDIVFAGNGYSPSRLQVGKTLKQRYGNRAGIFGNDWHKAGIQTTHVKNKELQGKIYPKTRLILNYTDPCYRHLSCYSSDRLPTAMQSGRPVLSIATPGMENIFQHGHNLYLEESDPNDTMLLNVIDSLLDRPDDELIAVGAAGKQFVLENCTQDIFVRNILTRCGHHLGD